MRARKITCIALRVCYFPRRFTHDGRARVRTHNIRGVSDYGEKRWRTDEIGDPDPDREGHVALAQAGQRSFRLACRSDQEEPAG